MIFKKIQVLLSSLFLCAFITCVSHNPGSGIFFSNDYSIIKKGKMCDPEAPFPQMILIPFFERATHLVSDCQIYPTHQVAVAFLVFYHVWLDYFGDPQYQVKDMLEDVMVEWGSEVKTVKRGYSIDGEPFTNRNVIGLVRSKSLIWVYQGYGPNLSVAETSLIHELVHLAIRAENGKHGDADHEGPKYSGWTPAHTEMIRESKNMLRAFGF